MIYPDLIEEKIRWYLWRKFTKKICDSNSGELSDLSYQRHVLNKQVLIPNDLRLEIDLWYNDTENLPSDLHNDLRRRVFRLYGLEAYLERPDCPDIEDLFMDIAASGWSGHSHFR